MIKDDEFSKVPVYIYIYIYILIKNDYTRAYSYRTRNDSLFLATTFRLNVFRPVDFVLLLFSTFTTTNKKPFGILSE